MEIEIIACIQRDRVGDFLPLNIPQQPGSGELLQHPQHLLAAVYLVSESNTVEHLAGK